MPVDPLEKAWLHEHVSVLRAQISKLTARAMRPGKGGAARAKEAADAADRLERRVSRLLRAAAHLDNQAEKVYQRGKRLSRSKSPKDRAELLVNAAGELPIDVALQVGEEILKQARARAADA